MIQETAFRKVVQATMIRDRQHGPVIEINRIQLIVALIIITNNSNLCNILTP